MHRLIEGGLIALGIALGCLVFAAPVLRIGFTRVVYVNNDPLSHPVSVASVVGTEIQLDDGRRFNVEGICGDSLRSRILESKSRIDLEPFDPAALTVYVSEKRFICGTHMPRYVIPIFRRAIPINQRRPVGWVLADDTGEKTTAGEN